MVKQLEAATGSVVVGQIGRTVIIYRPSLTKLKLEEKKRQARKIYVRRELRIKPTLPVRTKKTLFAEFHDFFFANNGCCPYFNISNCLFDGWMQNVPVRRLSRHGRRGSSRFNP